MFSTLIKEFLVSYPKTVYAALFRIVKLNSFTIII
nr:MAG TPA: hypothetical protein [Caudoviricetes sp.]